MSRFAELTLSIAFAALHVSASEWTCEIVGDVVNPGTQQASFETDIPFTDATILAKLNESASRERACLVRTFHGRRRPVVIMVNPSDAQLNVTKDPLLRLGDRLLFVAKTDRLAMETMSKKLETAVLKRFAPYIQH